MRYCQGLSLFKSFNCRLRYQMMLRWQIVVPPMCHWPKTWLSCGVSSSAPLVQGYAVSCPSCAGLGLTEIQENAPDPFFAPNTPTSNLYIPSPHVFSIVNSIFPFGQPRISWGRFLKNLGNRRQRLTTCRSARAQAAQVLPGATTGRVGCA